MSEPLVYPDLVAIARGERPAEWRPFRPGIEILPLNGVGGQEAAAALLRYEAGASSPAHRHTGHEHILVLTGSQRDERGTYQAGAFVVNTPGTEHTVTSDDGCVVLIVWERPIALLNE